MRNLIVDRGSNQGLNRGRHDSDSLLGIGTGVKGNFSTLDIVLRNILFFVVDDLVNIS